MKKSSFPAAVCRGIIFLLSGLVFLSNAVVSAGEAAAYPEFRELSFTYDGRPFSAETFSCTVTPAGENGVFTRREVVYLSSDGKLRIDIDHKTYKNFPVTEYSVRLTNVSPDEKTGLVEDFLSVGTAFPLPASGRNLIVDTVTGSQCAPDDFTPKQFVAAPGETVTLETHTGRSSSHFFPFPEWTVEGTASERYRCMLALGWTGSWKASFTHEGDAVRIEAGMLKTHFRLDPGQSILQPSAALFLSDLGEREFRTMVHRFMIDVKSPRGAGGEVIPPLMSIHSGGGNKTPEMMIDVLNYAVENGMPFDTYWVDAGWYGQPHEDDPYPLCGNWWPHVGNWSVNTATHPTGTLLPISDAAHRAGKKFLLWFEPERVQPESNAPILKEHPEYVHGNLLDLGNPGALDYIQKTIYGIIRDNGVDVYREDFNMDPQPVWDAIDAENPERTGLAEASHITGLYTFLDQMRREFPDLLQENCASGGRRFDIEMISRAHSYCRSDYFIFPKAGDSAFIMGQNATHNTLPYLPFQGGESNCVSLGDDYAMLSVISSGDLFTPSDFDGAVIRRPFSAEETAWLKKMFGLAARMNRLYMGDFFQLTPNTGIENDVWCAWQMFDSGKKEGFAIAFRRAEAPDAERNFDLCRIDPEKAYEVETYGGTKSVMRGADLARWRPRPEPRSFALIFFKEL